MKNLETKKILDATINLDSIFQDKPMRLENVKQALNRMNPRIHSNPRNPCNPR